MRAITPGAYLLQKLKLIKEQNKGNADVCLSLKMFGKCPNETECSQRHVFTLAKDAPAEDIPQYEYFLDNMRWIA